MGTESRMSTNIDDYEVICVIGSGSYGTCKKVRRKKDNKVIRILHKYYESSFFKSPIVFEKGL